MPDVDQLSDRVPMPPEKSWIITSKISRTWKVLKSEFGPRNSWKAKVNFEMFGIQTIPVYVVK